MNFFKKIGIEFINSEPCANGHEQWIMNLMSGQPIMFSHVEHDEIIEILNSGHEYLSDGDYKVIKTGLMATLVQFCDWEIVNFSNAPYMQNENWDYEAAKAEYEAEYEDGEEA